MKQIYGEEGVGMIDMKAWNNLNKETKIFFVITFFFQRNKL